MTTIKIIVRYSGAGWMVTSASQRRLPAPRPYANRDEAISDAFFASRMLKAMGNDVAIFVEGPTGIVETTSEIEHIWRRH